MSHNAMLLLEALMSRHELPACGPSVAPGDAWLRRIADPAGLKASGVYEGTGRAACAPGLRRKKGAELRFGRVCERGVPVMGAIRHGDAAVVALSAQGRDAKGAAGEDERVARQVTRTRE